MKLDVDIRKNCTPVSSGGTIMFSTRWSSFRKLYLFWDGQLVIVLGHAARQAWEKAGRKVRVLHDRILGIPLQSCGGLSWIYSIYAPTGVTVAQYDEFLNIIENNIITNHEDLSEAFYLIGDWNAHIGRDSKPDKVIIGPHTMRQCTSARGKT